jgi:hypothetical protein
LGVIDAGGLRYITLDSWRPKTHAMVCGANGIWKTENLNDTTPTWTRVLDMSGTAQEVIMICSSICQDGYWAALVQEDNDKNLYYYDSSDWGGTWNNVLVTNNSNDVYTPAYPKLELSSHDAQKAWISYLRAVGVPAKYYVSKTGDQGATWADTAIQTWEGYWPSNPHHRYLDNADDGHALVGIDNDIHLYANDYDGGGGSSTALGHRPIMWVGSYTWGTTKYWLLCFNDKRFYISDDASTWTEQYTFTGIVRFISGWPYDGEYFYAAQDGTTAPLLVSEDRGASWTAQTGNWNDLCTAGGYDPDIWCLVPVWTE